MAFTDFYRQKPWLLLKKELMLEREGSDGVLRCEHCGKPILNKYDCIGHHIEPLTEANVNDPAIAYGKNNIMLVHHRCHNAIHRRFGYEQRKVFIVYGSPCSGKSTFAREAAGWGDVIVDVDQLWDAVTGGGRLHKCAELEAVVLELHRKLLDLIYTRTGAWQTAYIVGGYPRIIERQRLAEKLGAELIHIDTPRERCVERLYSDDSRQPAVDKWLGYIDDYWRRYQPEEQLAVS